MEVILIEPVDKLGLVGDVVKVKNGYARNYLIPQGKVLRSNAANKAIFEAKRADIEKENNVKKAAAEKEAAKVNGKFVVIIRQSGDDGRLYGSVAARDIAAATSDLGVEITRNQIPLDKPIKYIGVYPERVVLHPEVIVTLNVNVARSAEEAVEAEKEFLNPTKKKEDKAEDTVEKSEAATTEEVKQDDIFEEVSEEPKKAKKAKKAKEAAGEAEEE